jgi:hypothetical protein
MRTRKSAISTPGPATRAEQAPPVAADVGGRGGAPLPCGYFVVAGSFASNSWITVTSESGSRFMTR